MQKSFSFDKLTQKKHKVTNLTCYRLGLHNYNYRWHNYIIVLRQLQEKKSTYIILHAYDVCFFFLQVMYRDFFPLF